MKLPRKFAFLAIVSALICQRALAVQDEAIAWLDDINQAKVQAAAENKLVLIHFWGTFCRPCLNLEKFVFTNPRVGNAIAEHYVPVKIDVEAQPGLAREFGITTIPHDVVMTPQGQIIARQASSQNSDNYLRMVENVAQKAARINPQTLSAAEQIALAAPQLNNSVAKAYVPAGQSSAIPEPIRMIGSAASDQGSAIQTVSGQQFLPTAQDERKLRSPSPPKQFIDELQLKSPSNSSADETASKPAVPATPAGHSLHTLRPLSESLAVPAPQPASIPNPVGRAAASKPTPPWITSKPTEAGLEKPNLPVEKGIPNLVEIAIENLPLPTEEQLAAAAKVDLPVGFEGACPATWFASGQFVAGDPKWGCVHRGRLYLFASRELREQFRLTPDVLSPMLAGYDPVEYAATGELIDGMLRHAVMIDSDRAKAIYLFSSEENKASFLVHSQRYIDEVRQALRAADQAAASR